jgi:hypothetical protein
VANTIPGLLNDTYHLVQLARESALAQGKQTQASKLSPVVDDLKNLVSGSGQTAQSTPTSMTAPTQKVESSANTVPAKPSGMMAQSDFQTLLNAAKSVQSGGRVSASNNITERNQMVRSMASSNMMDVDIARRMGMTREEVRLILSVGGK